MPALEDISVWIEMGEVRLEEYKTEVSPDGKIVSCWIACEPGKPFRIGIVVPPGEVRSANYHFVGYLDGTKTHLKGSVMRKRSARLGRTFYFDGDRDNKLSITRPFFFGALELTDDDACLSNVDKRFGEIQLSIRTAERMFTVPNTKHKPSGLERANSAADYRVHERSKKGVTHCVKFGDAKPYHIPTVTNIGREKTLCTFVFHYRQMDTLIANDIAPRKSKADNTASDASKAETMSEILKLRNKLVELEGRLEETEPGGSAQAPRRVKTEPRSAFEPGEFFDLTAEPVKAEPRKAFIPGEIIDLTL
ncbi:hypothetical protein DFP72DRAFT_340768 [Ephemerocybe angulata]|uniref:DUF7918 domain-containing protein n=1 Tax=Ephemerocybe angulata TaxID=980116 RepID=A0A8H6HY73_9AGAR|nr:hypothetical protein DFP72DRAFT_340768 [Tulosesus angulatus]